jgi:hypothetical protein
LLPYFYDLGIVEDCDIKPNSISHIGNFYEAPKDNDYSLDPREYLVG